MTNTPIIRVPIDDGQFKAFVDLFNKFSAKLEEMPAEWQALNQAMGSSGDALEKGALSAQDALALAAASTTAIVEAIALAAKEQDGFTKSTNAGAKAMAALGDRVKGVVGGVLELGRTVFKFGGIAGALAGIGGVVGIADLAGGALTAQRQAGGLGLSVGQMRAWSANMREFVGDNVLTGAASAQVDPSKYGWLAALGINSQQASNENAAALANQEINAVRAAWRANPSLNTAQSQAALALGFSVGDIRNVGGANGAYLGADEREASNPNGLGFSVATAHSWAQLSQTLNKAELTIQTALIDGLAPLVPILTKFSNAASGAIAAFFGSKQVQDGLNEFASWLGSPSFSADIQTFATEIKNAGAAIGTFLSFFGSSSPSKGQGSSAPVPYNPSDPRSNWPPAMRKAAGLPPIDPATVPGYKPSTTPTNTSASWMIPGAGSHFAAMEKLNGLPPGALAALAGVESGMNPLAVGPTTKYGTAKGEFQFIDDTAKQLGINPFNVDQATSGAAYLMGGYLKKYGSLSKAIAAYNWNPSKLDADITAHGANWMAFAPQQTQNEISAVLKRMGASTGAPAVGTPNAPSAPAQDKIASLLSRLVKQGIVKPAHVTISNSTSARVSISANAAVNG